MFDRLEDILLRFEEIMNQLSEPDVANDTNRFRKLMKEQSDLAPIVESYQEYKQAKQNIEDSLAMLEEENDEELRELAKVIASGLSTLELNQSKELLGVFVSDLFLSVSDRERQEFRCQRQAEGIAAARARGVRFGADPKPLPDNFDECYEAWLNGDMTATDAAAACGLSRKGFYRMRKKKQDRNAAV